MEHRVPDAAEPHACRPKPHQLSLRFPPPGDEDDTDYFDCKGRRRRRPCRSLKAEDVARFEGCQKSRAASDARAPLRTRTGEFLPPLYCSRHNLAPADAETIIASAEALLAWRCRRGVKILRDPFLLLRFLRVRLVSQPQPVFAVFFLDRRQRLIQFTEMFRGSDDRITVVPGEVVRETLACHAEQILCVRSDPACDHQPTTQDFDDARRVKRAMDLIEVHLMDYVVVGDSVTSLRERGVI